MGLRASNAFRSLLRQLGITPTIEGILDVLGAGFDFTFPDQVEVQMETPDPPENAGTYTMTSDARNILVTETAGGQSYAVVVLPAAEAGSACRVAVSEGQNTCLVFGPTGQYAAVVNAGHSIDLIPYGDGKYCAVTDMVQLQSTIAYLFGSASDTPSPTGSLWARVLHLQEFARCWYTMTLSSVIAGNVFAHGSQFGESEELLAVAASPGEGEFLVGATDDETAENLAAAIRLEGVTVTVDEDSITFAGPVGELWYNVDGSDTFFIDADHTKGCAGIYNILRSFDDRLLALEGKET